MAARRPKVGAIGYVGWEKLTTDKSVVRIVSDAVIGEPATDALADTAEDVRGLTDKAGEAVGTLSGAVAGIDSKLDGVSNFLRQAAAYLIFGRFGWLGKIAGAFLGMMLIGNNAGVFRDTNTESVARTQASPGQSEEQTYNGGMRR